MFGFCIYNKCVSFFYENEIVTVIYQYINLLLPLAPITVFHLPKENQKPLWVTHLSQTNRATARERYTQCWHTDSHWSFNIIGKNLSAKEGARNHDWNKQRYTITTLSVVWSNNSIINIPIFPFHLFSYGSFHQKTRITTQILVLPISNSISWITQS